jgi:ABC-type glycerol-3-phosphate transport system substrate-binding protein
MKGGAAGLLIKQLLDPSFGGTAGGTAMAKRSYLTWVMLIVVSTILSMVCVTAAAEKKQLRIAAQAWMFEKFRLYEAQEKFEAAHPGVEVIWTKMESEDYTTNLINWSNRRYTVDMSLGGAGSDAAIYAGKDLLVDWEDFFSGDFSRDKFIKPYLDAGMVGNKVYSLPFDGMIFSLTVRSDWMKEAGLIDSKGKPALPATLDDLYGFAKKLTKVNEQKQVIRYGYEDIWLHPHIIRTYLSYLQSIRGSIFESDNVTLDFGSPEAHAILAFWQKLAKDGYGGSGSLLDQDSNRNNFKANKTAMIMAYHSRWGECANIVGWSKTSVLPLPGKHGGSWIYVHGALIPKLSKQAELAKQFTREQLLAKWFIDWSVQKYGRMPVMKRHFEGLPDPEWKTVLLPMVEKSANSPVYVDYEKLQYQASSEFQRIIKGDITPEEGLRNVRNAMKRLNLTVVK